MLWRADELFAAAGARGGRAFAASGVSIDTRTLRPGDLFVALAGEARDGHAFVEQALAAGAAGVMVSRAIAGVEKFLLVEDTLAALTRLGAFARARAGAKIVAVTGSVGKTTTKEMLRRMLGGFGPTHAADASFNNHIGVPLTLARMPRDTAFAVLEIGMNHAGEIAPLARLARPHVAVITNIEPAHIGQLGSLEAIAEEKATLFGGLEPGGAAVLPGDSPLVARLEHFVPERVRKIRFGGKGGEVRLLEVAGGADGSDIACRVGDRTIRFHLPAPGRHLAVNAAAALAACHALGLDPERAAAGLAGFAPVAGRGLRKAIRVPGGEAMLLDESYNASGASVRAALAVLRVQPGRHVAVLGDMLELGEQAAAEHEKLAADVDAAADILFACGPMMRHLFQRLSPAKQGGFAPDAAALAGLVASCIRPGDAVLVKGSYGSRMRDVIAALEGG